MNTAAPQASLFDVRIDVSRRCGSPLRRRQDLSTIYGEWRMSEKHKGFAMIPNLVDDMGLSASARSLYMHIKRVCGDNKWTCKQSHKTMAEICGLSKATISRAKKKLVEHGLITVREVKSGRGWRGHEIAIVDVWDENDALYT